MKRFFTLALCLLLALSMVGCQKEPSPTESSSPTETSTPAPTTAVPSTTDELESTVSSPAAIQLPLVAVATPVVHESVTAEDGTVLLTRTYQNISLTLDSPEVADRVILDMLNRIDGAVSSGDALLEQARQDCSGNDYWNPYFCQVLYAPTRVDRGVLSFYGEQILYAGGAHPGQTAVSVNYDLVTGKILTLEDVLARDGSLDLLRQYLIEGLESSPAAPRLYSDYSQVAQQRLTEDLSQNSGWYFSTTGLCFYFCPYEIAPYSAGTVVSEIPYGKLAGILEDAFFPAEEIDPFGVVETVPFDVNALEKFNQLGELIMDKSGQSILLHTDGMVYDLRLETGSGTAEAFTPEATVYAASSLTAADGILIQYNWKDDSPALRLTYRTDSGTVSAIVTP